MSDACPTVSTLELTPQTCAPTWAELDTETKFSTVHRLIHEAGRGPPVIIKHSSLVVLDVNMTVLISCNVAGADYYLWDFPNGDFKHTEKSEVSTI